MSAPYDPALIDRALAIARARRISSPIAAVYVA